MTNPYGEWTTLDKLRPGAVFEDAYGVRHVKAYLAGVDGVVFAIALLDGVRDHLFPSAEVREIDLAALDRENVEMANLVHDRREDAASWVEHGAAMERTAILDIARWYQERPDSLSTMLDEAVARIAVRGPVLPQLPPDRLAAENRRLLALLKTLEWSGSDHDTSRALWWCCCPVCRRAHSGSSSDAIVHYHAADCSLAIAIGAKRHDQ